MSFSTVGFLPAWTSLVKQCFSAGPMKVETSICSHFSVWTETQEDKTAVDIHTSPDVSDKSRSKPNCHFTWTPQSLAVLLLWRTLPIVAVSCPTVAGQTVLGVGVSRTGGSEAGAVLCQVTDTCLRSADTACWFQLWSGEKHRWWCTDLLKYVHSHTHTRPDGTVRQCLAIWLHI